MDDERAIGIGRRGVFAITQIERRQAPPNGGLLGIPGGADPLGVNDPPFRQARRYGLVQLVAPHGARENFGRIHRVRREIRQAHRAIQNHATVHRTAGEFVRRDRIDFNLGSADRIRGEIRFRDRAIDNFAGVNRVGRVIG